MAGGATSTVGGQLSVAALEARIDHYRALWDVLTFPFRRIPFAISLIYRLHLSYFWYSSQRDRPPASIVTRDVHNLLRYLS